MPDDAAPVVTVTFTPEFKRNLRQLAKRYRHIRSDLEPLFEQLTAGARPGDRIPQVQPEVFKVRLANSDARKGKSGGYRIIYHVKRATEVVLVTLYSKSDQADVAPGEIREIIERMDSASIEQASATQAGDAAREGFEETSEES